MGRMHNRLDEWMPEGMDRSSPQAGGSSVAVFMIRFLFCNVPSNLRESSEFQRLRVNPHVTLPIYENLTFHAYTGTMTPEMIWNERSSWMKLAKASKGEWKTFSPGQKAILKTRLAVALRELHAFTPEWLPIVEAKSGNYVDLKIHINKKG